MTPGDLLNPIALDLLLSGINSTDELHAKLYRNDGGGHLTLDGSQRVCPIGRSDSRWGDYDNDGALDLSVLGFDDVYGNLAETVWYAADGIGDLNPGVRWPLVQVGHGSLAWADYDRDGDLDLASVGFKRIGVNQWMMVGRFYHNGASTQFQPNTAPQAPVVLSGFVQGGDAVFQWESGFDLESDPAGLTYNLRVGTQSGADDVHWAELLIDVENTVTAGRCGHHREKVLAIQPGVDHYYWAVQTVDDGMARSPWSVEAVLALNPGM